MTHGDNNGLVLPPRIAPTQVVIVPIAAHKNPEVLETAKSVMADLIAADVRVKLDDSDQSMGWKCAEYEMRGVPIRLELGPRDLAEGNCCLVRRDNGEKVTAKINEQQARLKELEQKKLEAENSEIVEIVRGMSVSLTDLPVLLQTIKSGGTLGQNVPKSADKEDSE